MTKLRRIKSIEDIETNIVKDIYRNFKEIEEGVKNSEEILGLAQLISSEIGREMKELKKQIDRLNAGMSNTSSA